MSFRQEIVEQLREIRRNQEIMMAEVQLDDSVLTSTAAAIESLVAADTALVEAVNTFLGTVAQQLPDADLTAINQAVTDAGTAQAAAATAQTALQNATPAAPTPPVDTPPATS